MATAPVEVRRSTPVHARAATPDAMRAFRTDIDRLFDRFAGAFNLPAFSRMFDAMPALESGFGMAMPPVDIAEDAGGFKLTAELPGLSEKDVHVTLSGDMLLLKGEKKQESEKTEANYYLSERAWGTFQRSFAIPPDVDRDKITAEFAKGVLTVMLPKTAQAQKQQKHIEVKSAA